MLWNKIKIEFYALSNKGRRDNNEDSYFAGKIGKVWVFAVADGLGGHEMGEKASKFAVEFFKKKVREKEGIKEIFEEINKRIYEMNQNLNSNMGTTLVAMIVEKDGNATIANVGDSRAYIFDKNKLWKTKDHSMVQQLLDAGVIDEEEALSHPSKNIVTQALGTKEYVKVDIYNKNVKNTIVMLCSDGLTDYVREKDIKDIITEYPLKNVPLILYNKAMENGSRDNITIVVSRIK